MKFFARCWRKWRLRNHVHSWATVEHYPSLLQETAIQWCRGCGATRTLTRDKLDPASYKSYWRHFHRQQKLADREQKIADQYLLESLARARPVCPCCGNETDSPWQAWHDNCWEETRRQIANGAA